MSSADDILFQPITTNTNKSKPHIDRQMIDAVRVALTGVAALEFFVDSSISIDTYDMIADMVEADAFVIAYTTALVIPDPLHNMRPANALTIKDVFRRLHVGENAFWFCGQNNGNGVSINNFNNWFSIENKVPIVGLDGGASGIVNLFEWWVIGLMCNFEGFGGHYAFATEIEARKYYNGTP